MGEGFRDATHHKMTAHNRLKIMTKMVKIPMKVRQILGKNIKWAENIYNCRNMDLKCPEISLDYFMKSGIFGGW